MAPLFALACRRRYRRSMRTSFAAVGLALGTVAIGRLRRLFQRTERQPRRATTWRATTAGRRRPPRPPAACRSSSETGDVERGRQDLHLRQRRRGHLHPGAGRSRSATVQTWNFTVTASDGTTCLSYQETGTGALTLTVARTDGERDAQSGQLGLGLTCPDGTSYSNSNALSLLSCRDGGLFGALPGIGWSSTDTSVSRHSRRRPRSTTARSDELQIFDCATP